MAPGRRGRLLHPACRRQRSVPAAADDDVEEASPIIIHQNKEEEPPPPPPLTIRTTTTTTQSSEIQHIKATLGHSHRILKDLVGEVQQRTNNKNRGYTTPAC